MKQTRRWHQAPATSSCRPRLVLYVFYVCLLDLEASVQTCGSTLRTRRRPSTCILSTTVTTTTAAGVGYTCTYIG
ncbi:hypothetical protein GGS23DRAFT_484547 [Durotheca rogersii]|uniref:uncharacterized protein n=1 Tax=Durotheca rogersii TaxID=419775 RepID=UPI0022200082|nr:uncharacterized protein GGS23DRAFT_484547 [Durotheca rogersii]KAI5864145.1 hypothetical protein GGS23DRAFT_484547 [Durotheca rogersii]